MKDITNNLETFITLSRYFEVNQLTESELFINFNILKEKHNDIIQYDFDEFGDSIELEKSINFLLSKGILTREDDKLYINIENKEAKAFKNSLDFDTELNYFVLIEDYFNENNKREIKKMNTKKRLGL